MLCLWALLFPILFSSKRHIFSVQCKLKCSLLVDVRHWYSLVVTVLIKVLCTHNYALYWYGRCIYLINPSAHMNKLNLHIWSHVNLHNKNTVIWRVSSEKIFWLFLPTNSLHIIASSPALYSSQRAYNNPCCSYHMGAII